MDKLKEESTHQEKEHYVFSLKSSGNINGEDYNIDYNIDGDYEVYLKKDEKPNPKNIIMQYQIDHYDFSDVAEDMLPLILYNLDTIVDIYIENMTYYKVEKVTD